MSDINLEKFKDLVAIQCNHGNWNYDPYMHGMANGMLLALAMWEGKGNDVLFLNAPEKWLRDHPSDMTFQPTVAESADV